MTAGELFAALNLPDSARVDQRVPKKMLLENGAPTAADKRVIADGIEEIQWLAVLKPSSIGVPTYRDEARQYLEIAVLRVSLRSPAKAVRIIELIHRSIPYPLLLLAEEGTRTTLSLAHQRCALNDSHKVVLDGELAIATLNGAMAAIRSAFLEAMDVARQPKGNLFALYQGWIETLYALQAAEITSAFKLPENADVAQARREALKATTSLQAQIAALRTAARKASQIARQVELNLQIVKLEAELQRARGDL